MIATNCGPPPLRPRIGRNKTWPAWRVIESLQLTATHQGATPVNWKQGEDVIIVPAVSDEQAREKFPGGWKTLKPYLRVVAQPGK